MKKILLVSLLCLTQFAHAGFLIEPYFGTHLNSSSDIDGDTSDITGTAMGARLGLTFTGLMLGLNYKTGAYADEDNEDLNYSQYGLFVGYDFPIMFRVWAEMVMGGSADLDSNSAYKWGSVSGTQLGIGYKLLPFVSLNLEVGDTTLGDFELNGTEVDNDVDLSTYMLSISFPI